VNETALAELLEAGVLGLKVSYSNAYLSDLARPSTGEVTTQTKLQFECGECRGCIMQRHLQNGALVTSCCEMWILACSSVDSGPHMSMNMHAWSGLIGELKSHPCQYFQCFMHCFCPQNESRPESVKADLYDLINEDHDLHSH
jgi:hypothetical protein